ncbi:unnamed protein product [Peronospora effusa]|nr:unnamed protein product [Peronospora effusa]
MATDLGNHYDKKLVDFLEMLEKSTKDSATEDLAKRIQRGYAQYMTTKKNAVADLYKMLGIENYGYNILSTPRFNLWVTYVKRMYDGTKSPPNPWVSIAEAMLPTYFNNYNHFWTMLQRFCKNPETEGNARELLDVVAEKISQKVNQKR